MSEPVHDLTAAQFWRNLDWLEAHRDALERWSWDSGPNFGNAAYRLALARSAHEALNEYLRYGSIQHYINAYDIMQRARV